MAELKNIWFKEAIWSTARLDIGNKAENILKENYYHLLYARTYRKNDTCVDSINTEGIKKKVLLLAAVA